MEYYNMLSLIRLVFFALTEIAFLVGVILHVFIIVVNVIEWRRGRAMSTSDQVIISIMISRMILQSVMQLNLFWESFCIICSPIYHLVMRIIYFSNMYYSIWLSTLLCVVFYLKISNSHGVVFLWMKRIVSQRILHFIIASLLVSIGQTSAIYSVAIIGKKTFVSQNSTHVYYPIYETFAVSIVNMYGPLLILMLSSLFLITSLYLHIRHMRCNGTVTSSLDPYYRIIMYMAGSIVTSVLCVVIQVLGDMYFNLFGFVSYSFPWTFFGTLHSMLLIYATPKLKTQLSKILRYISSCWRKKEESRDFVMTVTT